MRKLSILTILMFLLTARAYVSASNCQYSCQCPSEISGNFSITITTSGDCTALEPPNPDKSIIYSCAEQCLMAHELKQYKKCNGTPPQGQVTMDWVRANCH